MSESPHANGDAPPGDTGDSGEEVRRLQAYLGDLRQHVDSDVANKSEWEHFVLASGPAFARLARSHHVPPQDRDDYAQDLWLTLVTRLASFRYDPDRGAFGDWLSVVAEHRLIDCQRCRQNRATETLGWQEADRLPGRELAPEESLERQTNQKAVRDALDELRHHVSPRDHEAYRLRWLEGCSVDEIAGRLGMTKGQVWSSHHRTTEKLRPLLARRLNGSD
jgi:RNA polymerase sigma factor (sigma-70 family)